MTDSQIADETTNRDISLDGSWLLRCDPDDVGVADGWSDTAADWDDSETHVVEVPHAWQEVDGLADYCGVAWYRRSVTLDEGATERDAILRFGAVDYETTVWVNGVQCGENRGGYLPFEVDATEAIGPGTNVVTVRVEDPENIDEIPHGKQGDPWYTRVSGIWQSVSLELRPETRVSSTRVMPDLDADTAEIEIDAVGLGDETTDYAVRARVLQDGDLVTDTEPTSLSVDADSDVDQGTVTVSFEDPDYWHPDDPALYDLAVDISADGERCHTHRDHFGMRSVSFRDQQLYLNGEPLVIRGALDQGYYPETLYRPFEDGLFEREIQTAKDFGFNLLRKHIKPAHPDFLEAADRLGLLVWEEVANPARYTDRSIREVREQAAGLIDRDFNRPSVIIWSLYNEEWGIGHHHDESYIWDDPEKQETLGDLYEQASEWDPTRLLCDNSGWAHVATDINDYHRYFASPDRADGWAEDLDDIIANPGNNYAAEWTDPAETPIVMSEFGTWGFTDTDRLEELHDGAPPWFYHPFLVPEEHRGEELDSHHLHLESGVRRSPAGYRERYEQTALPEMVGDLRDLAEMWQWRQWVSLKDQIEEMRTREELAGYVITQWTDLEWEFNGLIDYLREPKAFHDELAIFNDPLIAVVEPDQHVCWAGDSVAVDVSVVNDTGVGGQMTLSWALTGDGATLQEGTAEIEVPANGPESVTTLSLPLGAVTKPRTRSVEVSVEGAPGTATNSEPLVVVPPARTTAPASSLFVQDGTLAERLRGARHQLVDDPEDADLIITDGETEGIRGAIDDGTPALFMPSGDAFQPDTSLFDYRELPPGENWYLASATYAQSSPLLADVSDGARVGWEFEGLYPYAVASDLDQADDEVHVGYIEGWMANWGSPLVVRETDAAQVCSCTFRVADRYGEHPMATLLIDRLIDALGPTPARELPEN